MAVQRALLLIADIGGYTRFMSVHRVSLAHAQDIVARLLEAVIDAAKPELKLSKLEGDAALFYASLPAGDETRVARQLAQRIADIHHAFAVKRQEIFDVRMCTCDPCMQAGKLRLKFVAHAGEVAFQKVKRFVELAGVDVIVVHRLLKNNVPVSEYLLMTEPVIERLDGSIREHASEQQEDLEGLGPSRTFYVDLATVALPAPKPRPKPWWARLLSLIQMNLRSIPFLLGAKRPCRAFRNMEDATRGLLPAPPPPPS